MANIQVLFGARKSKTIAGITIDAFVSENHEMSAEATKMPVEDGSSISDHIRVNPDALSITGIVGPVDIISGDGGATRVLDAYEALRDAINNREPVTIVTGLRVYEDMAILRYTVDRDKDSGGHLAFTLSCEQIKILRTQSIAIPKSLLGGDTEVQEQAQSEADVGKTSAEPIEEEEKESYLEKLRGNLNG